MINPLSILGAVIAVLGLALFFAGLARAVHAVFRRQIYRRIPLQVEGQGIWSGAVAASQVYVPGTIVKRLAQAGLGLLLWCLGGGVMWSGLLLAAFVRVDSPGLLGKVRLDASRLSVLTVGGEERAGRRPGPLVVAHAEYIEFGGPLERLGMGHYARLVHLSGYSGPADVLARRPLAGMEVGAPNPLHRGLSWLEPRLPDGWVKATRRFSMPVPAGTSEAALWGMTDGMEWRR